MNKLYYLSLVVCSVAICLLNSCTHNLEEPAVKVSNVTITSQTLILSQEETAQLEISVFPEDASDKTIDCSTSDVSVATVDFDMLTSIPPCASSLRALAPFTITVTAIAPGTTTITATTSNGVCTASCDVTVIQDDSTYMYNGHKYVNLGLPSGLKWATCNVGANSPDVYGDKFAWGEITRKDTYTWSDYTFRSSGDSKNDVLFSKYNTSSQYGVVDNKTTLELDDDAARANWGGSWRTPTKEEFKELLDNSTSRWAGYNGVYGKVFTSNINGNGIFLPVVPYDPDRPAAGDFGYYLSSSLLSPCNEWGFSVSEGDAWFCSLDRCEGFFVRPVTE